MKVGLIGTGFGTRVHMPARGADPSIEVVAICSARRSRAEQAADEWGVPFAGEDFPWDISAPQLEGVVAMTWMLASTTRVSIGVSVMVIPLRQPIVTEAVVGARGRTPDELTESVRTIAAMAAEVDG
jgi:hypothetical protein